MKNKIFLLSFCLFLMVQQFCNAQDYKDLNDINTQVWESFTKAFETYDYSLFASIHSQDLVRVSGDGKSIKLFSEYIEGYKNRWVNKKGNQIISFRFLERIVTDNYASERGIYKLTVNLNTYEEKSYYGQFHVLLKHENKRWKLIMDYDSSEMNTINEASYKSAFAIDAFEKY